MAKQIIRLTENDLHRLIENTVNKMMVREDWTKSYDEWADDLMSKDAPEKNRKWSDELKKEYPDKNERRKAVNKHMKKRDVAAGKTSDKKYWRDYDKEMNESLSRLVDESVRKAIEEIAPAVAQGLGAAAGGGIKANLQNKNDVKADAKDSLNGNALGSGNAIGSGNGGNTIGSGNNFSLINTGK